MSTRSGRSSSTRPVIRLRRVRPQANTNPPARGLNILADAASSTLDRLSPKKKPGDGRKRVQRKPPSPSHHHNTRASSTRSTALERLSPKKNPGDRRKRVQHNPTSSSHHNTRASSTRSTATASVATTNDKSNKSRRARRGSTSSSVAAAASTNSGNASALVAPQQRRRASVAAKSIEQNLQALVNNEEAAKPPPVSPNTRKARERTVSSLARELTTIKAPLKTRKERYGKDEEFYNKQVKPLYGDWCTLEAIKSSMKRQTKGKAKKKKDDVVVPDSSSQPPQNEPPAARRALPPPPSPPPRPPGACDWHDYGHCHHADDSECPLELDKCGKCGKSNMHHPCQGSYEQANKLDGAMVKRCPECHEDCDPSHRTTTHLRSTAAAASSSTAAAAAAASSSSSVASATSSSPETGPSSLQSVAKMAQEQLYPLVNQAIGSL